MQLWWLRLHGDGYMHVLKIAARSWQRDEAAAEAGPGVAGRLPRRLLVTIGRAGPRSSVTFKFHWPAVLVDGAARGVTIQRHDVYTCTWSKSKIPDHSWIAFFFDCARQPGRYSLLFSDRWLDLSFAFLAAHAIFWSGFWFTILSIIDRLNVCWLFFFAVLCRLDLV